MIMEFRDGLLFTEIEIKHNNKTKILDNIVVDTGATKTLISQEAVNDIGIRVSRDDKIITSYGIGGKGHAFVKNVDYINLGDFQFENYTLDFSKIEYKDINGLLGLDLLIEADFIIDLQKLNLYRNE